MAESYFSKEEIEAKVKDTVDYEWIEGYKGTDRDMRCRGFQYEIGKQYDMPEDAEIKECASGFHLCKDLDDVFGYYEIVKGNRFFKVKALVKKPSLINSINEWSQLRYAKDKNGHTVMKHGPDKYVAKSIIFERELTKEEILKDTEAEHWTDEYQTLALELGLRGVKLRMLIDRLIKLGYSPAFSKIIVDMGLGDIAEAVGQQEDLSMDMKILTIFEVSKFSPGVREDFVNKTFNLPYIAPLSHQPKKRGSKLF